MDAPPPGRDEEMQRGARQTLGDSPPIPTRPLPPPPENARPLNPGKSYPFGSSQWNPTSSLSAAGPRECSSPCRTVLDFPNGEPPSPGRASPSSLLAGQSRPLALPVFGWWAADAPALTAVIPPPVSAALQGERTDASSAAERPGTARRSCFARPPSKW